MLAHLTPARRTPQHMPPHHQCFSITPGPPSPAALPHTWDVSSPEGCPWAGGRHSHAVDPPGVTDRLPMNTKRRLQGAVSQHRANSSVGRLRLRARDKMQLAPARAASLCPSALLGEVGTGLQRLAAPLHREPGLTLNAVPPTHTGGQPQSRQGRGRGHQSLAEQWPRLPSQSSAGGIMFQ